RCRFSTWLHELEPGMHVSSPNGAGLSASEEIMERSRAAARAVPHHPGHLDLPPSNRDEGSSWSWSLPELMALLFIF
ncbi:Os03g0642450, partial [Oryza sativa Japonica Group]